jgi:hypothetical protein
MTILHARISRLAGIFVVVASATAAAQMSVATGRDTLRSLPGVEVLVEPLQPALEEAGLTARAVKAGAEEQLRAAGVPLFPSQGSNPSPAKPYLYVHLNALSAPEHHTVVFAIQVQLRQAVRSLATGATIVDAVTWDSHGVVEIQDSDVRSVQRVIAEHVDRFARDWKAVH